jgi:hypothetical protein
MRGAASAQAKRAGTRETCQRADGERQGTVAALSQPPRRSRADRSGRHRTAPPWRRSCSFAAVDSEVDSGTLIGLQLPVFAMDFPMDPSLGFRGDSALNSGPWRIERPGVRASRRSRRCPAGCSALSWRWPDTAAARQERSAAGPVKIRLVAAVGSDTRRARSGPTARRAQSDARRALHRMALVGLGMSLAPTLRLASTNSGEEGS